MTARNKDLSIELDRFIEDNLVGLVSSITPEERSQDPRDWAVWKHLRLASIRILRDLSLAALNPHPRTMLISQAQRLREQNANRPVAPKDQWGTAPVQHVVSAYELMMADDIESLCKECP